MREQLAAVQKVGEKSDFYVIDSGREYRVFPASKAAHEFIKQRTGVEQRSVTVTYGNYDTFFDGLCFTVSEVLCTLQQWREKWHDHYIQNQKS